MKNLYIKIQGVLLLMLVLLSQIALSQESTEEQQSGSEAQEQQVNLVFDQIDTERMTGSHSIIDVETGFLIDSRRGIGDAINGKVLGVFDSYNTWGTGNAVIVVDGVRQTDFFYNRINIMEVESIVVLKDAVSKALYGALGDQGVILINTKRGRPGEKIVRVSAENRISEPRALPEFLGAADFMEKLNEAYTNDGLLTSIPYTPDEIDATRAGTNPVLYPDNDFYSSEYIKEFRNNVNVIADVTGGNDEVQYYVNTEFSKDNGWLNTAIADESSTLNFRGNLDFRINKSLKMRVDAVARLSFDERPNDNNDGDYWDSFGKILPNAYPVLWDPAIIEDEGLLNLVSNANLVNGKLLGGTSSFADNQIYGELTQSGTVKYQERIIQYGATLDADLSSLTEGLSAKGYFGMNFYNSLFTRQTPTYAIYEPVFDEATNTLDTVLIHGLDEETNRYNTVAGNSGYYRQTTFHGSLAYDRKFGKHAITAIGLMYGDLITNQDNHQKDALLHMGISANYMYDDRYILEGSLMQIGSRKLSPDDNMELAPSVGVGWVLSQEAFMSDVQFVDYLKVRASYGVSKNDNWGTGNNAYYRWEERFTRSGNFEYNNGSQSNGGTVYTTVTNDIWLQKRRDISFGFITSMFENTLNLEFGYFNSESLDNLTEMSFSTPQLLGYENLVFSNYNSDRTNGIELGLSYTHQISESFSATLGSNMVHISPEITKREEEFYVGEDVGLLREGTATDAMWGLIADGLYSEADFLNGNLVAELPVPTWGDVQPGDIKYIDQNGDGFIDDLDQRIVGHGVRTQYSIYLDLRYKNFSFYALGIGRLGDSNTRNDGDNGEGYFQVQGLLKYSKYALQAYGPNNQNLNASHPRLTTLSGGNNDRNSSFWVYKNNNFRLPTMQLTYRFEGKNKFSFLKQARVYLRGSNLVVMGKNKEYTEVNPYGAPNTRTFVVGLVTSF